MEKNNYKKRMCPRTKTPLKPIKFGNVTVDISEYCGGVFFDANELKNFDDKAELHGDALVNHLKQGTLIKHDASERIKCPECKDVVMMRNFYNPATTIEVDECPQCSGVWLDTNELEELRHLLPNEASRQRATDKFIDEVMSSPEVTAQIEEKKREVDKIKALTTTLWTILLGSKITHKYDL